MVAHRQLVFKTGHHKNQEYFFFSFQPLIFFFLSPFFFAAFLSSKRGISVAKKHKTKSQTKSRLFTFFFWLPCSFFVCLFDILSSKLVFRQQHTKYIYLSIKTLTTSCIFFLSILHGLPLALQGNASSSLVDWNVRKKRVLAFFFCIALQSNRALPLLYPSSFSLCCPPLFAERHDVKRIKETCSCAKRSERMRRTDRCCFHLCRRVIARHTVINLNKYTRLHQI